MKKLIPFFNLNAKRVAIEQEEEIIEESSSSEYDGEEEESDDSSEIERKRIAAHKKKISSFSEATTDPRCLKTNVCIVATKQPFELSLSMVSDSLKNLKCSKLA